MTGSLMVTIPGGYWANGTCWREAHLRELTGEDECVLAEEARTLPPARWATEALTRCLTRLGPPGPVTREAVRSLSVGDREALLLHLRRVTTGDRLLCVVTCPRPDCGEILDLDLKVSDFLLPPSGEAKSRHEAVIGAGEASCLVRFRLPTGGDQEAVAALAQRDLAAAAEALLSRCVESTECAGAGPTGRLPPEVVEQLPARMAELDPQAELILHITCSACGSTFVTMFDAASFLLQELGSAARTLYHEVHLLAYHYHWSLAEILGMSARSRYRYLELLAVELSARGGA